MAILLKTDTRPYSPVYNKMTLVIFQDDSAIRTKPDYRYLFDIYITDPISVSTVLVQVAVSPDPTYALGKLDIHGIIEQYVVENFVPYDSTDAIANTINGLIKYRVEYGEEYRLTSDDPIIQYPDELTGVDKYAWGASLEHHRWIDFYNIIEYTNYLFDTNNVGEFLTNYKTPSVYITDLGWHWYLTDTPTDIDFMRVLTYDVDGVLIDTFDIPNNSVTAIDQSRLNSVATAPQSLNNITGAFLVGAQPVITSSVATYTIQCFKSPSTAVGEILTFTIDSECYYETYRVHFENEYGAYDSFNFKLNSKRFTEGERKSYISNKDNLSSSGITFDHAERKKVNYYTKNTNKVTLRSEHISQAQNDWLKELSFCTECYLEFVDNSGVHNFKPAIIRDARWDEKKTTIDKLFTFEIDIELADNGKQRR